MSMLHFDVVAVLAILAWLALVPRRRLARARQRLGAERGIVTWQRAPSRNPWVNAQATIGNALVIVLLGVLLVAWTATWDGAWVPHVVGVASLIALARLVAPALPTPVVFGDTGLATPDEHWPWSRLRGSLWIWGGRGLQMWWRNYGEPDAQVLVADSQRSPLLALLRARFGAEAENSIDDRMVAASA